MTDEVEVKEAKAPKAKPKGETKVEQGTEPLNKVIKNNPVKREVLQDGTIVEHY